MSNPKHPITSADGRDITEAVQVLYDLAHSSMDWGSGMLSTEEMNDVVGLAVHMGWQVPSLNTSSASAHELQVATTYPEHYEVSSVECKYSRSGERWIIKTKTGEA